VYFKAHISTWRIVELGLIKLEMVSNSKHLDSLLMQK
jgi:hypothetical protein